MKIFDCFLFFNEIELLEKRLEILYDYVDYFVIAESPLTFSGNQKELFFEKNKEKFTRFNKKIIHYIIDANKIDSQIVDKYTTNREVSIAHKHNGTPLIKLHTSCQREVHQRDSLIFPLYNLALKDDFILISDLDEIPKPAAIAALRIVAVEDTIYHFRQNWYLYWINNYCQNEWFGTRACRFSFLNGRSIDQIRFHTERRDMQEGKIVEDGGWHFSYLGGEEKIREKLSALAYQGKRAQFARFLEYIHSGFLRKKIINNGDILLKGRKFNIVTIDETYPSAISKDALFLLKFAKKK